MGKISTMKTAHLIVETIDEESCADSLRTDSNLESVKDGNKQAPESKHSSSNILSIITKPVKKVKEAPQKKQTSDK